VRSRIRMVRDEEGVYSRTSMCTWRACSLRRLRATSASNDLMVFCPPRQSMIKINIAHRSEGTYLILTTPFMQYHTTRTLTWPAQGRSARA
jgi:hypothetical protein